MLGLNGDGAPRRDQTDWAPTSYVAADRGVTVVMPAYNEEANLAATVEDFLATLETAGEPHRVVIVNDGSTDATGAVAESLAARSDGRVLALHHAQNQGYGAAVRTGIQSALERTCEPWLFLTDSDGQFRSDGLIRFLTDAREERADAVIGYRDPRCDSRTRKVFSWCWTLITRLILRHGSRDVDCAYKLVDRRSMNGLGLVGNAAVISPELITKLRRNGARVIERPVKHLARQHGKPTGAELAVIWRSVLELLGLTRRMAIAGRLGRLGVRLVRPRDGVLALLTVAATASSVATYAYFAGRHLTVAYPDTMSHLLIGRRVIESSTPGLGQLGGVWLPLPHLLMLPTIWIDSWYYSGFSGSLVSMVAYVLATRYVYKAAMLMTAPANAGQGSSLLAGGPVGNRLAATSAALLFAANANVLYLQSTAMTETLLLACMAAATYHLLRWCRTGGYRQLAATAFALFLASITRYEGWWMCFAVVPVVALVAWNRRAPDRPAFVGPELLTLDMSGGEYRLTAALGNGTANGNGATGNGSAGNGSAGNGSAGNGATGNGAHNGSPATTSSSNGAPTENGHNGTGARSVRWKLKPAAVSTGAVRERLHRAEADVVYLAFIALMGIVGWALWNLAIFHNALYFQTGQFAKPSLWVATSEKAIGHWGVAVKTYLYAMEDNLGIVALGLGAVGIAWYVIRTRLRSPSLAPLALLAPLPFYVASLYFGQRPLHVTQIDSDLYNVRFGLIMILPVALFGGYLVGALPAVQRRGARIARGAVQACVVGAIGTALIVPAAGGVGGIVTLKEALSARTLSAELESTWLQQNYDGGLMLMESFGNDVVTFQSHIPTDAIIYEGSYRKWNAALDDPVGHHIRWIYMRQSPGNRDIVWAHLHASPVLRADYKLVYSDPNCLIYKRMGVRHPRLTQVQSPPGPHVSAITSPEEVNA